jgi:hypothetical protein
MKLEEALPHMLSGRGFRDEKRGEWIYLIGDGFLNIKHYATQDIELEPLPSEPKPKSKAREVIERHIRQFEKDRDNKLDYDDYGSAACSDFAVKALIDILKEIDKAP